MTEILLIRVTHNIQTWSWYWVYASACPVSELCGSLIQQWGESRLLYSSPFSLLTSFLFRSHIYPYSPESHFLKFRVYVNTTLCPCYNWEIKNLLWKGERQSHRRLDMNEHGGEVISQVCFSDTGSLWACCRQICIVSIFFNNGIRCHFFSLTMPSLRRLRPQFLVLLGDTFFIAFPIQHDFLLEGSQNLIIKLSTTGALRRLNWPARLIV